jgi:ATP-dependent Clp protease protease subunit
MKCPIQVFNFLIKNAGGDSVDIHVDGDIVDASTQEIMKNWFGDDTSVSFRSFRDQLNAIDAKVYNVYINSYGGLVTDAMAMHDFMEELESKGKTVNRIGRGIVASAATYLLMGKNSSMTKNSWFMIHNVSGAVAGDVDTVENYATTLRKFNNRSRDFYTEFTSIRKEDISKMMNSETWMTAQEAVDKGFVKNIVGAQNFSNRIAKENWNYSNMAVLNSYNADVKPPQSESDSITNQLENMKKFFQDLGTEIMNAIKGVKAPENNDHSALMGSIGEAVNKSFEAHSDKMEGAVQEMVNTSVASEKVTTAITNQVTAAMDFSKDGPAKTAVEAAVKVAVENATKDYSTKITALEAANVDLKKKNDELESDITALKGKKTSTSNSGEEEVKPVGKWNKN